MRSLDQFRMIFVAGGAILVSSSDMPFLASATTSTTNRLAPRRVQSCGGDASNGPVCLHGGQCIESHFTDSPEQFVCDCTGAFDFRAATGNSGSSPTMETDRYVGRFCENVVAAENYCARDAELFCINQGTCRNDADDFHITPCTCPESHTGKHCEFDVSVEPLSCNLDCGEHGTCRNGRKKDSDQGPDAFIDYSLTESMNYMYCECSEGHTGALCEYDFISCGDGQFEHYCFHGSECEQIGEMSVCSCETANGRVAGDACQYKASDECERVTGGLLPNGAQFCVNGGTCEQELSSGTTYCKCGDEFGGSQCEAPKETAEDQSASTPVSNTKSDSAPVSNTKTNADIDLASSLIHQQRAPTPAPTAEDTIQDTEMDQRPIDGSEPDPADDPAKFFNLDFPVMSNSKNKGEAAKTESAHHNGNKSSSTKKTESTSQQKEGMSALAQFCVFLLLACCMSVLAVAIYRRHRMRKFGKEKNHNIHNANLHHVGESSSGADGVYRDEIYKNAIFDAEGKVEAVEIL